MSSLPDNPEALRVQLPVDEVVVDTSPVDQLQVEQFDALMRDLLPSVQKLWPHLSPVEALRAAANLAELRLKEGGIVTSP